MKKYVVFDSDGNPSYTGESQEMPDVPGVVELPLNTDQKEVIDSWYLSGSEVRARPTRPSLYHHWSPTDEVWVEDIEELRAETITEIDRTSEVYRARSITGGSGQVMTYEAKYQEAIRHPSGTSFPFLSAEARALGVSVSEVADSVVKARAQWESIGAQIEAARLKAKSAARKAKTSEGVRAAVADLSLAFNQL